MAKTYRPAHAPPTWACRGVSLEVETGCVYGLLGPNGAGKSTMMSMLTGIEVCDSGDGYINGSSVTWELETARLHIGLCPQFDALMDNLNAREHLQLLADIRGVPKALVSRVVERALSDMALTEKAGAVSKTYSGGNKRKLSVAMSIVANPKVLAHTHCTHAQRSRACVRAIDQSSVRAVRASGACERFSVRVRE